MAATVTLHPRSWRHAHHSCCAGLWDAHPTPTPTRPGAEAMIQATEKTLVGYKGQSVGGAMGKLPPLSVFALILCSL